MGMLSTSMWPTDCVWLRLRDRPSGSTTWWCGCLNNPVLTVACDIHPTAAPMCCDTFAYPLDLFAQFFTSKVSFHLNKTHFLICRKPFETNATLRSLLYYIDHFYFLRKVRFIQVKRNFWSKKLRKEVQRVSERPVTTLRYRWESHNHRVLVLLNDSLRKREEQGA